METANTPALLLLDLPPAAFAGIDLLSFTVTPRFRGVKNLPPGFHFAFCATSTAFSERHGLWFHIPNKTEAQGEVPLFIAKWNAATESLEAETDEAERMRWRANLGSVWHGGLTPYRQTTSRNPATADDDDDEEQQDLHDWPTLTSHLTPTLLTRITASPDTNHWSLTSASSARRDLEDIPGLSAQEKAALQSDHELHLLPIDLKQTWPPNATGRARTTHARDRSWALENLPGGLPEVLGEIQFSFLALLTLNNVSAFHQWIRLLELLLTCVAAVPANTPFFTDALVLLRVQLSHCADAEAGLIDLAGEDDEGGDSLLRTLLVRFRTGLEGIGPGADVGDVLDELEELEEYLRREHGWQFGGDFARVGVLELEDGERVRVESTAFDEEDEMGEFAPLIVELTAEQASLLGVSTPEDKRALGVGLSKAALDDGEVAGVVQDSDEEEEDNDDDDVDDDDDSKGQGKRKESDEEEMQDLDDMDSRY